MGVLRKDFENRESIIQYVKTLAPWAKERYPISRVDAVMPFKNLGKLIRKITVQLETLAMAR